MSEADESQRHLIEQRKGMDRAAEFIRQARKMSSDASGAIENGNLDAAWRIMQGIDIKVLSGMGVCFDPNVSSREAPELAIRVLGSSSVLFKSGGPPLTNERLARGQETREVGRKIQSLATEMYRPRNSKMTISEVAERMSDRDWDAAEAAEYLCDYLDDAKMRGSINQKREGAKILIEISRSTEPKILVQVENEIGSMNLEDIKKLEQDLIQKCLKEAGVVIA